MPIFGLYNSIVMFFSLFKCTILPLQILFTIIFIMFIYVFSAIVGFYMSKFINKYIIEKFISKKVKTFMLNNNHNPHVKYLHTFYNYIVNNYKDTAFLLAMYLFIGPVSWVVMFIIFSNNISFDDYLKFMLKITFISITIGIPLLGYLIILYIFYSSINDKIKIHDEKTN